MTPADCIRAAITRCYEESPVLPTADDFSAAVCKALADVVVPLPRIPYDSCCDVHAAAIRAEILAIAAELEGKR